MSHDLSALPVRADSTDAELLESVITFYRHRITDDAVASQFLARRGLLHPGLLETFELGLADRELGRRLPPRSQKTGRQLRDRLTALGIYRPSGHGNFNGSLVVPLRNREGQLADLYGHRLHRKRKRRLASFWPGVVFAACRLLRTWATLLCAPIWAIIGRCAARPIRWARAVL